jgi:hypothetical protein
MSPALLDQPEDRRRFGKIFQPSAQADDDVHLMLELLDLQDSAPPIRRLRDWALSAVALQAGQAGQAVADAARAGYGFSAVTAFGFVARKGLG